MLRNEQVKEKIDEAVIELWNALSDFCHSDVRKRYDILSKCDHGGLLLMRDLFNEYTPEEFLEKYRAYQNSITVYERGDVVKGVSRYCTVDGIYLGDDEDYFYLLCEHLDLPQKLDKEHFTLLKNAGKHVDIFGEIKED